MIFWASSTVIVATHFASVRSDPDNRYASSSNSLLDSVCRIIISLVRFNSGGLGGCPRFFGAMFSDLFEGLNPTQGGSELNSPPNDESEYTVSIYCG